MAQHIILFNHSPQLLRLYEAVLTQAGYSVSILEEDDAGLDRLRQLKPDLIILGNIRGISEDEWDFLVKARQQPETKATPVIVSSTGPANPDAKFLQALQPIFMLSKPFHYNDLLRCAATALAQPSM